MECTHLEFPAQTQTNLKLNTWYFNCKTIKESDDAQLHVQDSKTINDRG